VRNGNIAAAVIALALVAGFAPRNAEAQTSDQGRTADDLRDAEAAAKRHRAELMKIPHVRVVTAEIDPRKDAVILVEVDDPRDVDEVARKLPPRIEGFPVEVDKQDEDSAAGFRNEAGRWEEPAANATRFPTIDGNGYYHHTWLTPASPAPTPGASQ
jgi:hypothetical protein